MNSERAFSVSMAKASGTCSASSPASTGDGSTGATPPNRFTSPVTCSPKRALSSGSVKSPYDTDGAS